MNQETIREVLRSRYEEGSMTPSIIIRNTSIVRLGFTTDRIVIFKNLIARIWKIDGIKCCWNCVFECSNLAERAIPEELLELPPALFHEVHRSCIP